MATKPKTTASQKEQAADIAAREVATTDDSSVPAYLRDKQGPARGSENVGADDLVIPRLELVQSLSPCLDDTEAGYIEGSKAGMLYNNVTRQLYGTSVEVIPVYFKKEYIIWKDRKKGGGYVEACTTMEAAEAIRTALPDADDHRTNDTANHFCLLKNPVTGKLEDIVVSMAVTKLKVSRTWNSLIRLNGGDSFGRCYVIGSAVETNKNNEKYNNLTIRMAGFPTEPEYLRAEALYLAIAAGQVQVNRDQDAPSGGNAESGGSSEY